MFLLVALSEVLLFGAWVCRSEGLCSPTTFYKNCWIRRFPGLSIDLEPSQKLGAQILNVYSASTGGQCSRACCILKDGTGQRPPELNIQTKNNSLAQFCLSGLLRTGRIKALTETRAKVSCNLAVFYYKTNIHDINCIHMYCPVLESCIVKPTRSAILYNITPGVDPDLLVFEKLSFKDINTRSSFNKWERHGGGRVADLETDQDELSSPRFLFLEASSPTTGPKPGVDRSSRSSAVDAALKNSPVTLTALTSTMGRSLKATEILPRTDASTTPSDDVKGSPVSGFAPIQTASLSPGGVLPNTSKALNESKVYSGRNNSADGESQQPSEMAGSGAWLPPMVLCSLSALTGCCCCCGAFLATGRKKRGRYRPRQKGKSAPNRFVKYTAVKSSS